MWKFDSNAPAINELTYLLTYLSYYWPTVFWRQSLWTGQFTMPTDGARRPPDDVTGLSRDREPPAAEEDDPMTSSCRYQFASSPSLRLGRVYSPRYPRNFPEHMDCVYRFRAASSATGDDHDERIFIALISVQLGQPPGHYNTTRYNILSL